jgi:glutathione S-transferase
LFRDQIEGLLAFLLLVVVYLFPVSLTFQIDEWLEYAPVLSSGPAFENGCKYIDDYLEKRTFLVGYSLSIADLAICAGLAGKYIFMIPMPIHLYL